MTEFVPEEVINSIEIYRRGGHNYGDEDFTLFKCPSCSQIYLMDYEVDTVYLEASDLSIRVGVSGNSFECTKCGKEIPDGNPWIGPLASEQFRVSWEDLRTSEWAWVVEHSSPPFSNGWTKDEIEASIEHDRVKELIYVPIVITMKPIDCKWAEAICVNLTNHGNTNVRGNAILGLGHLARTCRRLNKSVVEPLIQAGLKDRSKIIRGQAQSAAEGIEQFLGWKIQTS